MKYTVLMVRTRQNEHKKASGRSPPVPRVIRAANIFGCSRVIAHIILVRRFEQIGISVDTT